LLLPVILSRAESLEETGRHQMFDKSKLAVIGLALALGTATPSAAQDWDPYTQCLIDHCFGNFQGDPAGYEACRRACARQYPPQIAPSATPDLTAKLD
jgi:hypothetical protein